MNRKYKDWIEQGYYNVNHECEEVKDSKNAIKINLGQVKMKNQNCIKEKHLQ